MNKEANVSNLKVGDKVVYNIDGMAVIKLNRPDLIETFKSITYGVVIGYLPHIDAIKVQWVNYKGIVVFPNWGAKAEYLELYKP